MTFYDNLQENEVRITGVMVDTSKTFEHRNNLRTIQISARSFGKSFYEDERKPRSERVMIELHDNASHKADWYRPGDILYVKGQLASRQWVDGHGHKQIRLVVVVDDPRNVNKISENTNFSGNAAKATPEAAETPAD